MAHVPQRGSNQSKESDPTRIGFALRFISGKYQGGEFPLEEGREIVVGRSSELDMVLVEELVSRKHARIQLTDGSISVEDLGSTNGTFVNGERIHKATLREGDRLLIGTSILKVITLAAGRAAVPTMEGGEPVLKARATGRHRSVVPANEEAPRMTGNLEEIPLPDLLQLFGNSKKSGVLRIRSQEKNASIFLVQGNIRYALIEGKTGLGPLKAIYRTLGWTQGIFDLDPPEDREFPHPIDSGVQEILMEAFRQIDEFQVVRESLPLLERRLILRTPLEAPLHELEPSHLEVLQLALNCTDIQELLDRSPRSDLETGKIALDLLKRGYLEAASER